MRHKIFQAGSSDRCTAWIRMTPTTKSHFIMFIRFEYTTTIAFIFSSPICRHSAHSIISCESVVGDKPSSTSQTIRYRQHLKTSTKNVLIPICSPTNIISSSSLETRLTLWHPFTNDRNTVAGQTVLHIQISIRWRWTMQLVFGSVMTFFDFIKTLSEFPWKLEMEIRKLVTVISRLSTNWLHSQHAYCETKHKKKIITITKQFRILLFERNIGMTGEASPAKGDLHDGCANCLSLYPIDGLLCQRSFT